MCKGMDFVVARMKPTTTKLIQFVQILNSCSDSSYVFNVILKVFPSVMPPKPHRHNYESA